MRNSSLRKTYCYQELLIALLLCCGVHGFAGCGEHPRVTKSSGVGGEAGAAGASGAPGEAGAAAVDDWTPPAGVTQCDGGRNRRCLHADKDADGLSVAEGDCDDSDPRVLEGPDCEPIPFDPPPTDCAPGPNCDRDADGLTPALGDCDDTDANVYPGALELCGNAVDEDCTGFDLGCGAVDADGDGVTPAEGDCDDGDPFTSDLSVEVCGDGVDNDCREGDLPCDESDQDGDGFTPDAGDCDDQRSAIHPGALELCGDGLDNDCDGVADSSCEVTPDGPVKLDLSSDEPVSVTINAELPDPTAGDVGADVFFLVDLTNSYDDDLATYRTAAADIVTELTGTFGDLRLGLASFRDAPCSGIASSSVEYAYRLGLPLNADPSQFVAALDELAVAPNNTTPEAALEGIHQVLTGEGHQVDMQAFNCLDIANIAPSEPGWEPARIPVLIVATDAPFHRPGDSNYPYPTTDQQAIEEANARGASIFFMSSGEEDPEANTIAEATGGQVFELASNSEGIIVAVGQAIDSALSDMVVDLVPDREGAKFVESIEPSSIEGVNLLVDDRVSFSVTFKRTLTPKTHDQVIAFELILRARGGEVARIPIEITIEGVDV